MCSQNMELKMLTEKYKVEYIIIVYKLDLLSQSKFRIQGHQIFLYCFILLGVVC